MHLVNATRLKRTSRLVAVLLLIWIPGELLAQQGGAWRGDPGVKESVGEIMAREGHGPGTNQPQQTRPRGRNPNQRVDNPDSPKVAQWPPAAHPATADTGFGDPKSAEA